MSGSPQRTQGSIGPLNDQLMNSAIRNLTRSRNKVVEFIHKEENLQRREKLISIFHATKIIADRFEGMKASEVFGTSEYRDLCRPAFNLIREQRHAGRKLLFLSLSDPILGLDVLHFGWFPTIRGTSASQLSLMDPFLDQLKGIKVEPKPFCYNEPKSRPSQKGKIDGNRSMVTRSTKNAASVTLKHQKFKSKLEHSIRNVFKEFNVPFQTLEQVVDTADLPNEFKHKVNILVNVCLVSENVPDAAIDNNNDDAADPVLEFENETAVKKIDEDGFWIHDSDSDFDERAREYNRSQLEKSRLIVDNAEKSEPSNQTDQFKDLPNVSKSNPLDDAIDRILKRFEDPNYESPALGPLINMNDSSTKNQPADRTYNGSTLDNITMPIPSAASTPGRQNERATDEPMPDAAPENEEFEEIIAPSLPRPNNSVLSSASGESIDVSVVHQPPLETPKPRTKRLNRQLSLQPFARMANLESEDEDDKEETAASVTAPVKPTDISQLMEYIDMKFEKLEASFNSNK